MVRRPPCHRRHSLLWPGPLGLALALVATGCFDDPPMVVDDGEPTSTGVTTSTTVGPTTMTVPTTTTGPDPDSTSDPTTDGPTTSIADSDSSSSATASETEPSECDAEDGQPDPACPAESTFCVGGACVPCSGGGDCGALDPATPVCGADDVCRPCLTHYECPGNAGCHLFEGTCLSDEHVYYVDPNTNCGPGAADEAMPACTLDEAFDAAAGEPEVTIRLTESVYLQPVNIAAGRIIAITGEGATTIASAGASATVTIEGTGYLANADIQHFSMLEPGVESNGDLWLDDVMVRNNDTGVLSNEGRLVLRRVRILDSGTVGVILSGSEPVQVINSIIAGGGFDMPSGIVTYGPAPLEVLYSTIVENAGIEGGAIDCGPGSVTVRNSIVTSSTMSNAIDCGPGSSVTHSVVSDNMFDGQPTNVGIANFGELDMDVNYDLGPGSLAIDVAQWELGDPPTDINGTDRPNVAGSPDDAGADRSIE